LVEKLVAQGTLKELKNTKLSKNPNGNPIWKSSWTNSHTERSMEYIAAGPGQTRKDTGLVISKGVLFYETSSVY
jgi:hypothetical protein